LGWNYYGRPHLDVVAGGFMRRQPPRKAATRGRDDERWCRHGGQVNDFAVGTEQDVKIRLPGSVILWIETSGEMEEKWPL